MNHLNIIDMKYNVHIYCTGFRFEVVNLVLSFCAKFKDIACTVNLHHIFHVPRRFYSVNKSCSIVFQLHMIPDYVSIVY